MHEYYKIIMYSVLFVIFLVAVVTGLYLLFLDDTKYQKSVYDNVQYKVRQGTLLKPLHNDSSRAADYLAILSKKIDMLVDYMYVNKIPNQETANRLWNRWKSCELRETSSYDNNVAFTVNKGYEMRVCIRDPKTDGLEDINSATFVLIHELSHLMSVAYGHSEEFKENFFILAHEAAKLGLYTPVDYYDTPVSYCGTKIYSTPCSQNSCSI